MKGNIFSELWYKVANLKVSLNTSDYIKKQVYRGEVCYIIEDKYNNQFFKISPEAYFFISKLNVEKTVEEIWEDSLKSFPQSTPSQDEVISLLTSLHHKNLLYFKNRAKSEQLIDRANIKKKQQLKAKLISFLYLKVPLFDPDKFLDSIKPLINVLFSKFTLIIWLVTLLLGLVYTVQNFSELYNQTQGMLAPSKLFLLYICIVILKTLHEFGHSMMVKKFGGRVNVMGVMILIFTPIPFMDATQSWTFRSKYQRILVGGAGMMVELFIAAICAIIWANTGEGIINSICFNMMIIGSVSSLIFNGNPLLKFDSYFMLSDYLEIPNLYENSKKECFYLIQKYVFKIENLISISSSKKESAWMVTYAILSFLYRLFVAIIIAMFVADQWFILGVIVLIVSLYLWIVKPIFSFIKYILNSPQIRRVKKRVYYIVSSTVFILFMVVFVVPFSFSVKANGIVLMNDYKSLYTKTSGFLKNIHIDSGDYVNKGDLLITFENKEIEYEINNIKSAIEESKAYQTKARSVEKSDLVTVNKHLELLDDKLKFLIEKKSNLEIRAQNSGYFVYSDLQYQKDVWFNQGKILGTLIPSKDVHFTAVIPQEESFNIFSSKILAGSIKLHGLNEETIQVKSMKLIPFQKQELPSAALGWLGGGDIEVSQDDKTGTKTKENFFEIRAEIIKNDNINFYQGRSGVLKINLESKTISDRFTIFIKQILQKHYKI